GPVGAGAFNKTAAELAAMTATPGFIFNTTQNNPGSDSPAGCGANSNYDINYRITQQRWSHDVPGAVSDVLVAPRTSPTSWYTTPENVQHIAYVGTDQRIHELSSFLPPK